MNKVDWADLRTTDAIAAIRAAAEAIVDGIVGHSLDDAPDKVQHRAMYDRASMTIRRSVAIQVSPATRKDSEEPIVSVIAAPKVGEIKAFLSAYERNPKLNTPVPELEGATVGLEYNYLCIRNASGWLLWKRKLQDWGDVLFTDIIAAVVAAHLDWLANGSPDPKPEEDGL